MNTTVILDYLSKLDQNNNREWFHAHKTEYQEANAQFELLVQELMLRLGKTDSRILNFAPKELTFKVVRDTRFSHDKSPYNPVFRAHISSKGKLPIPVGYYLMIKPGDQSFLGGGLFADMFKDATTMVREYIFKHPDEWMEILQTQEFKDNFQVQGTALKNVPKEYDKEHPQAEYLKYKCWYLEYSVKDSIIQAADSFLDLAAEMFLKMKPFNDFLNCALEGFQMPER